MQRKYIWCNIIVAYQYTLCIFKVLPSFLASILGWCVQTFIAFVHDRESLHVHLVKELASCSDQRQPGVHLVGGSWKPPPPQKKKQKPTIPTESLGILKYCYFCERTMARKTKVAYIGGCGLVLYQHGTHCSCTVRNPKLKLRYLLWFGEIQINCITFSFTKILIIWKYGNKN